MRRRGEHQLRRRQASLNDHNPSPHYAADAAVSNTAVQRLGIILNTGNTDLKRVGLLVRVSVALARPQNALSLTVQLVLRQQRELIVRSRGLAGTVGLGRRQALGEPVARTDEVCVRAGQGRVGPAQMAAVGTVTGEERCAIRQDGAKTQIDRKLART